MDDRNDYDSHVPAISTNGIIIYLSSHTPLPHLLCFLTEAALLILLQTLHDFLPDPAFTYPKWI